jgi:hypothetical protein
VVVHRLIQDVTRQRTAGHSAAAGGKPVETVLSLLRADLPGSVLSTPGSWPRWRALLPSVLAATGHHEDPAGEGKALSVLARPAEALPLQQWALRIREATLGPDHPFTRQSRADTSRNLSPLNERPAFDGIRTANRMLQYSSDRYVHEMLRKKRVRSGGLAPSAYSAVSTS